MRARWPYLLTIALSVALAAGSFSSAVAQTDSSSATMRVGSLYYMNGDTPVRIEESTVDADVSSGLGLGVKTYINLSGTTSDTKISETRPRFRIRAPEKFLVQRYRLGAFEVKKDKRQARTDMKPGAKTFFKTGTALEIKRIDEGLYELVPAEPLKPGEYGISQQPGAPVADFTITAPEEKK
jgi:hypothetical protein